MCLQDGSVYGVVNAQLVQLVLNLRNHVSAQISVTGNSENAVLDGQGRICRSGNDVLYQAGVLAGAGQAFNNALCVNAVLAVYILYIAGHTGVPVGNLLAVLDLGLRIYIQQLVCGDLRCIRLYCCGAGDCQYLAHSHRYCNGCSENSVKFLHSLFTSLCKNFVCIAVRQFGQI